MSWTIFYFSLAFLVGVIILGYGGYQLKKGQQSRIWPKAPAEIKQCDLREHENEGRRSWQVAVRYNFSADGKAFSGDRIAFGYVATENYDHHLDLYRLLKKSKKIEVAYDSENPKESVIASGVNQGAWGPFLFGLIWLIMMTGFAIIVYLAKTEIDQVIKKVKILD